jgi:hypothetical protein
MAGQPTNNPVATFNLTSLTIASPGLDPTTIFDFDLPWSVSANFAFGGAFAAALVAAPLTWTYRAVAESMGPGVEVVLGQISGTTNPGQTVYGPAPIAGPNPTIPVAARRLPVGVYRVTGLVTIAGFPILGFNETVIQIAGVA